MSGHAHRLVAPRVGGDARVTGGPAVRRRHPPARRAARQARHAARRPGPDHRRSTRRAAERGPRRPAASMTAADLPQPVPALRSPVPAIGRSWRSVRPSTTASRWPRSPPTRRTPPTRPRGSCAWSTRSCRRSSRRRRPGPGRAAGPGPGPPPRTTRWPARTCSREHRVGWGDVDARRRADLVVENTYAFPMVTHFAIEPHALHGGARRRRHRHLELDPASVLAAEDHGRGPRPAPGQGPRVRPRPGRRLRRQAARRSTSRWWPSWRCALGRPVRLILTLEETFQTVRRTSAEVRVRTGLRRDGTLVFEDVDATS